VPVSHWPAARERIFFTIGFLTDRGGSRHQNDGVRERESYRFRCSLKMLAIDNVTLCGGQRL
jgi:hypothetical protein